MWACAARDGDRVYIWSTAGVHMSRVHLEHGRCSMCAFGARANHRVSFISAGWSFIPTGMIVFSLRGGRFSLRGTLGIMCPLGLRGCTIMCHLEAREDVMSIGVRSAARTSPYVTYVCGGSSSCVAGDKSSLQRTLVCSLIRSGCSKHVPSSAPTVILL